MPSRQTIPEANDPLAQLGIGAMPPPNEEPLPPQRFARAVPKVAERPTPSAVQLVEPERPRTPRPKATVTPLKVKFNARIPAELADEVRDCVVALYSSDGFTIDGFTAQALKRELDRLKKQHNEGRDFPKRNHAPKPGRPVR